MSREGTLVKNTAIITIGKICTQMISFFLLPVYTAILTSEEYGIVDLLNTFVMLFIPLITLQIEQALFRELIDNRSDEEKKKEIISTTIFTVLLQCLIFIVIFFIISPFIKNDYKYFLIANIIANIFSSIMLQISRGLGDNKNYAISSFITAFFTIVFNILFIVVFKFGAYGMLVATLLANILCILYILTVKKVYRYLKIKKFSKILQKRMLKYSLPLVPNSLSWWIFNSSNRVIVSGILGVAMNGILSISNKFSGVYITIYNIFNLAWTEMASLHINDKDREVFFNNVINTTLKIFVSIAFGIIAFMPFIFNIMINNEFSDAYNQIPIFMIASIFNVFFGLLTVIYIAKKDTKTIAKTSIISAIINILINLILIKFIGLYAASISTLVSYMFISIRRYVDINKRYLKILIDKKFIAISIVIGIVIFISYYINNIIFNILSVLIVMVYSILINYKSIYLIKEILLNKIRGKSYE